ncbi:hypothetical protein HMSSN139_15090 [Paenibacillus sp. HMSSN-139]|nr:hypothetical protein HMSSN139_15090 [Paenibacillus sp. HMSSN-139]
MSKSYKFSRIGYVYVPTSNIDESIRWYTDHLEFKLMNKFEDRGSTWPCCIIPINNRLRYC